MSANVTRHVLVTDYAWPSLEIERDGLGKIGAELVVSPTGQEEELQALAPQADAILTNWKLVSGKTLAKASKCVIVSRYGVGVDNIDVEAATTHGIVVTNVPDYCMDEVSTEAIALLLCGARRIMVYDRLVRAGGWDMRAGIPFPRLWGLTLGIIGFGRIGRVVAPKAQAFGLRVIAYDPYIDQQEMVKRNVTPTDFDTLLRESDFVTLHTPLTPETTKMIGEEALGMMKRTAWLINTARGGVVDTEALAVALQKGRIAGASLDVMPQEPPAVNDPLRYLPNVIMTPHSAFYSEGSLQELQAKAVKRIVDVFTGKTPDHIINPAVLKQDNCRLRRR